MSEKHEIRPPGKNQPPGWKSPGAIHAERYGLLTTGKLAGHLHVPFDFVALRMPKHEMHYVRDKDRVMLKTYYDPILSSMWLKSEKGQNALMRWNRRKKPAPVLKSE